MKINPTTSLILAGMLATCLFLGACSKSDEAATHIAKATEYIVENNFAAAEIELKNALSADRQNPEALALFARIYTQQGRLREAYQILSFLKQSNPSDANSLATLASIELAAGLREPARADAMKALEIDPNQDEAPIILSQLVDTPESLAKIKQFLSSLTMNAPIHIALGSLELRTSNFVEANKQFDLALAIDANAAFAYVGKFQILLLQNKQEEAKAAFTKAAELAPTRSVIKLQYVKYLQQSKGDEAASVYLDEINKEAPDYLPALALAADLALKMNQNEKAKKLVERALKLDPIDPTAMRVNGTLFIAEGKTDKAIEQLEQTVQLYPNDLVPRYQLALAYMAKRDLSKAKSNLSKVVEIDGNHFEANALLSAIQIEERDFSGAIVTLETFLKTNPNSTQGYLLLAEAYDRKGDSNAAIAIYSKLETLAPETPQLDYLTGLSYLRGKDKNRARSAFESALTNNPFHLQSIQQLTELDLGDKNFQQALDRIDQIITATPSTSILYTVRGQILTNMGEIAQAIASYEKSIELDPKNRSSRMLLASIRYSNDEYEAALAQAKAVVANNPKDVEALNFIAVIHDKQDNVTEATATYEKILEVDPNHLTALNNLAYIYSTQNGELEKAFELAKRARDIAPNNPYTADTVGWIAHTLGNHNWALSLLTDSYSSLKDNSEVAYHLGSVYYALGNKVEATKLLAKATSDPNEFPGKSEALAMLKILEIDPATPKVEDLQLLADAAKNKDAFALVVLGKTQANEGENQEAITLYNQALEIHPDHLAALVEKAIALDKSGKNAEALQLAEKASKLAPRDPLASKVLAETSFNNGDFAWATNRLLEAAKLNPRDSNLQKLIALSYFATGNLNEATKAVEAYRQIENSDELVPWKEAFEFLADPTHLEKPTAELPAEIELLCTGIYELRTKNYENAQKVFQKVLADFPNQEQAKLGLAETLILDPSNAERVNTLSSEVRKLNNNSSAARAMQGLSLYQRGREDQAKQVLKTIAAEDIAMLSELIRSKIEIALKEEEEEVQTE